MKSAFLLVGLLLHLSLLAQIKAVLPVMPPEADAKLNMPFAGIQVLDARFDQTNIGSFVTGFSQKKLATKKLEVSFPDSLRKHLPIQLQRVLQLDNKSPDELLVLVKRFRLADNFTERIPELALNISVSFFLRHNGLYYKTGSIDKIISAPFPDEKLFKNKRIDTMRSQAFGALLTRIFQNRSWQRESTGYALDEIKQALPKRFQLPALTDSLFTIGLYRTYSEFCFNKPSTINVSPTYAKNGALIGFNDTEGKSVNANDYWGGSDGKQTYVVFRNFFHPLIRNDQSFKFFSFRASDDLRRQGSFMNIATEYGLLLATLASGHLERDEIFYLNMDDGSIHLEELFGSKSFQKNQAEILRQNIK